MSVTRTERDLISRRFLEESASYRLASPLFSALARASAADDELIELAAATRPGQSKGLLIFFVVQYLLLKSPEPKLAQYFASLTEEPKPPTEAFLVFKEYCLGHRAELRELLSWRTVNTNLVEKAICLVPALRHIERLAGAPLTLVELCCSAGLNMLFDEYHYDYGAAGTLGVESSPVHLRCRILGSGQPPLEAMPQVTQRVGVDLVRVDLSNSLEQLWMQAVLCPEWRIERSRLKAALSIRTQRDLRIIQGDALEVVGPLLEELPGELCILMSYCRGHWSMEARAELDELLRGASRHRDIHRLDVDPPDTELPQVARTRLLRLAEAGIPVLKKRSAFQMEHTSYSDGDAQTRLLGEGDLFGEWLDWQGAQATQSSRKSAEGR